MRGWSIKARKAFSQALSGVGAQRSRITVDMWIYLYQNIGLAVDFYGFMVV